MKKTICLILFALLSFSATAADGPLDEAGWTQLVQRVEQAEAELSKMIRTARNQGVCVDYALVSKQVISIYQKAAQYDYDHMDEVEKIFKSYGRYSKIDPVHTWRLPQNELEACIDIAAHAQAELQRQLDEQVELTTPPDFSKGKMVLGKGAYRLDGRPVFPSTLVWAPSTGPYMDALGYLGGGYLQISQLNQDGTPNARSLKRSVENARELAEKNAAPIAFLMGHSPAKWQAQQHPEILHGGRNFTKYDIDNPWVRGWIKNMCEGMLPDLSKACGNQPMIHLIANEPHFATARGGWKASNGLSDITLEKFHRWLDAKYHTIAALNKVYGTSYAAWDEVLFEKTPVARRQIDKTLRGTPVWYDWNRFNQARVSEWFAFLKEQSQANDGGRNAPMSIKTLGFTLSRDTRDGGMDIEVLTRLQDVMGADLRVAPRGAEFYGKHEEGMDPLTGWQSVYAYDWSEQAMYLDFSKSICPDKVFYDSEWHGFGAVSWRHFNMSRDYVRSALWMAFSHGMGVIKPWVWGRDAKTGALSSKTDHIGELSTQPVAVDAFGRTMKELNAHAAAVVRLVPKTRAFLIYYCEESAIQDENYTRQFKEVYEALKLLNLPVGFTTPTEIGRLDPSTQTVLVPPTPYISDHSLSALKAFPGRVVTVGESFGKNEMGAARCAGGIQTPFAALAKAPVVQMVEPLKRVLDPVAPALPVEFVVTDLAGQPAYGVMINQSVDPKNGEVSLLLNNISKDPRVVTLKGGGSVADVIAGRQVESRLTLDPCEVHLLVLSR